MEAGPADGPVYFIFGMAWAIIGHNGPSAPVPDQAV
jgi:hypothetical protein